MENYLSASLPIEHLSDGDFGQIDRLLLALGEVLLEGVAEGHQLVDFGDDAFLFGCWRNWNRTISKLCHVN
jgi:hypothetical protein